MSSRAWSLFILLAFAGAARAQSSTPQMSTEPDAAKEGPASQTLLSIDPYEAYAQGRFADAFDGFANLQAKRPQDVDLMLNMGAALYRLKDYAGADKAWQLAFEHGDPNARAQALYDLGNSAFQQDHLQQAVQHYQSALGLDAHDEDAKHNLQLAQRRLEQQKQQPQKSQDQNTNQDPNASLENQSQKTDANAAPNSPQPQEQNQQGPPQQPQEDNKGSEPQDGASPQAADHNSIEHAPQPAQRPDGQPQPDKTAPDKDLQGAPDDGDDASKSKQAPTNSPQPGDTQASEKGQRMPRAQAERILDAMGEARPRHGPSNDKQSPRPADGRDW